MFYRRLTIILAGAMAALAMALPASAPASVATAEGIAQGLQNDLCGDAWQWRCESRYYTPQRCFDGGPNTTVYQCSGVFTERFGPVGGSRRYCDLYVHVQKGTGRITWWNSNCY